MGNSICGPSILSNSAIKIIHSDGKLELQTRPINAAELMVDNPGQFVCEATDLKVGNRIPGLSADEELECRRVYFLLPLEMLYSVLTSEEMSAFTFRASRALMKQNNFGKIFPVHCIFSVDAKEMLGGVTASESRETERYSKQRSWRPALETIVEYPR
uniref:Uncharacterized protein n=1 Tax=Kalanchoe fedtschenkoi TaxID=63787 RepID=A0A7N0VGA1_KALFE